MDKYGAEYCWKPRSQTQLNPSVPLHRGAQRFWKHTKRKLHNQVTMERLLRGVFIGTITSSISDTRATLSADLEGDPFIKANELSRKIFHLPNGITAKATRVSKL